MKTSFWQTLVMMAGAEDEREFLLALDVFEKKIEKATLFFLAAISVIFFASALVEFRSMGDFVFRVIFGLALAVLVRESNRKRW